MARWRFTDRTDGDMAVALERDAVLGPAGTWLRQVHGSDVVVVRRPGEHRGAEADGAVTASKGAVLMVRTADCGPLVLTSDHVVGVAHAGWRGLAAGVVERTVDAMVGLGAQPAGIVARIGPLIRPECYEFGPQDLESVARTVGDDVRATTAWGAPALDVAAGIVALLHRAGVSQVLDGARCTACSPRHFSHRARAEAGRQAALVWLDATP